jgi:hypothetical protein
MATKNPQKNSTNFICEICDYKSCKKSDYDRHLQTQKHFGNIATTNGNTNPAKQHKCDNCDKKYKDRTGLWKHKKTCVRKDVKDINDINDTMEEKEVNLLVQYLMKENAEFKQLMLDQNKQMVELAKKSAGHHNSNNNNTNNNNNNSFNLNFFLNETCKNAMNIMDFVNQLQVGIKDLEETGRLGFAEGISKIFINGLKDIDVSDRPVHCSDSKREVLYIKNNDQWNKESDNKVILTNAIKHVAHKNMKTINEWTKEHPDFNDSDSKQNDRYLKIVSESMSGSSSEETNKNYNKIIKNIAKETIIDKEFE